MLLFIAIDFPISRNEMNNFAHNCGFPHTILKSNKLGFFVFVAIKSVYVQHLNWGAEINLGTRGGIDSCEQVQNEEFFCIVHSE